MAYFPDNYCLVCKHGHTHETSHEWIETKCDIKNEWMSPYTEACENFEPNPKYFETG